MMSLLSVFSYEAAVVFAERVQASPLGEWLSESALAFPVIEGLHLISLAASVGLLFLIDLRLLGLLWRDLPLAEVLGQLRKPVLLGFGVIFATGVLLFFAEAPTLVASPAFPFKLLFIALAGINALWLEKVSLKQVDLSLPHVRPPVAVRWAGLASLLLWTAVIVCGRLIPYLPSWD
jgi:hypothetical protein